MKQQISNKNSFSKNWNFKISSEFLKLTTKTPKILQTKKVSLVKTPTYYHKMRSQKGFMIIGYKTIKGSLN
jgi:hypothetical protein